MSSRNRIRARATRRAAFSLAGLDRLEDRTLLSTSTQSTIGVATTPAVISGSNATGIQIAPLPTPLTHETPYGPFDPAALNDPPPPSPAGASVTLSSTAWTPVGPAPIQNGSNPFAGRITGVAVSPTDANTIYIAAAGGGVWKTVDGGSTWNPLTDNVVDGTGKAVPLFMGSITIDPLNANILYAGTGEANNSIDSFAGRGILKSTDAGATWTLLNNGGTFEGQSVAKIVVDPTNDQNVFAVVDTFGTSKSTTAQNSGIYKSTNGGSTWTTITGGITYNGFNEYSDLVIDSSNPSTMYMAVGDYFGTAAGTTVNGVYRTTNGGSSWSLIPGLASTTDANVGRISLALSGDNSTLYVGMARSVYVSSGGELYKLYKVATSTLTVTDQTSTTPSYMGASGYGQGWYNNVLLASPTNPNVVYAGGSTNGSSVGNIYSTNGGSSWTNISFVSSQYPHTDDHAAVFDSNGNIIDGNDGGVWRYNPTSNTWTNLNGNLQITQFTGISLDPTNASVMYGGSQDNGTEKFTGTTPWTLLRGGDGGFTRVDQSNPSTVYHTFAGLSSGVLERSDNGGTTWAAKTTGISLSDTSNFYIPFIMDPGNSSRLLLGTNKIYETTNKGDNWSAISPTFTGGDGTGNVDSIAMLSGGNIIYAAAGGQIWKTTNHGGSWSSSKPNASSYYLEFKSVVIDPNDATGNTAYAAAANYNAYTGGGQIWKTTNGGSSWTVVSGNLPNVPVWSMALDSVNNILYVGTDTGVYMASNPSAGSTFTPVGGSGMPNTQVVTLELSSSLKLLAAGTHGRGAFEISLLSQPPISVALNASSDTGSSSSDGLTDLNNTAGKTLQFTVNGTSVGATVGIYADGVLIGSAVASGVTTTVTTDGTTTLSDGLHTITARQTEVGKYQSADSSSVPITVDSTPPVVSSINRLTPSGATTNASSVTYRVTFSESVYNVSTADFTLVDVNNTIIGESITSVSASTGTVIDVTVSTGTGGNGILRLDVNVPSAVINDQAGNAETASYNSGQTYTINRTVAQATFLTQNTTTGGSWKTIYGVDGYQFAGDVSAGGANLPSYVSSITMSGATPYVWDGASTNPAALQKSPSASTDRVAAVWYGNTMTFDIHFTDTGVHRLALYGLDYNYTRTETVSLVDDATGYTIDSQSLSSMYFGKWLVWDVSGGSITVQIQNTGPFNAVLSGLFFGGGATTTAGVVNATTSGNWKGVFGGDGYEFVGDVSSSGANLPSYVSSLTVSGATTYTWDGASINPAALLKSPAASIDRVAAAWNGNSMSFDIHFNDTATHRIALYALDYNYTRTETVSLIDDSSGATLDTKSLSSMYFGKWLVWDVKGSVTIVVTNTGPFNAVVSGLFFGKATATTAGVINTTTSGSWKNVFGGDGYEFVGDVSSSGANLPSYVSSFRVSGATTYTWDGASSNPAALQKSPSNATDRVAAAWNGSTMTFDIHFNDSATHRIALYALDYNYTRTETVQLLDAGTGALLDSQSLSSMYFGKWIVWDVSGSVQIVVTNTGPFNAVVSGLFFGSPSSASFVTTDTTTQGNWKSTYGQDGYQFVGDVSSSGANLPSYVASVGVSGASTYIWDSASTNPAALIKSPNGSTDGVAAAWDGTSMVFDIHFNDTAKHRVAIYLLDYDGNRSESVSLVDDGSGTVLNTQSASGMSGGKWLVWDVTGSFSIVITNTGPTNAVLSGLFFGPAA